MTTTSTITDRLRDVQEAVDNLQVYVQQPATPQWEITLCEFVDSIKASFDDIVTELVGEWMEHDLSKLSKEELGVRIGSTEVELNRLLREYRDAGGSTG